MREVGLLNLEVMPFPDDAVGFSEISVENTMEIWGEHCLEGEALLVSILFPSLSPTSLMDE